jgi:hypothetical protein
MIIIMYLYMQFEHNGEIFKIRSSSKSTGNLEERKKAKI